MDKGGRWVVQKQMARLLEHLCSFGFKGRRRWGAGSELKGLGPTG